MKARLAVALALVTLAMTTGCGDDNSSDSNGVESKPAAQILDDAVAALRRVKSFHVEAIQGGSGSRSTKVTADVEVPATLRLSIQQAATSASIIAVDDAVYIKANEAYWKDQQTGRAAPELADKWLKSPTSAAELRDISKGLDPETLSRCLAKDHGTIAKGGTETVDGQRAVVLIDKGDRPGTAPGKLLVAATGDPLPLRTIATGDERPGGKKDPVCDSDNTPTRAGDEASFGRYNESLDIKAPPGAVDLGAAGTPS